MPTLYELTEDLRALEDVLMESGGEITDEQIEATIDQWFKEIGDKINLKIDGYCYVISELELMAKGRREEAERITAYARTDENNAKRLKAKLKWWLETRGVKKFETLHFKPRICNNGGKQPLTHLKPIDQWPEEYVIKETVIKPDTEKVVAAIEAGEEITFAKLEERGSHLRIR